MTCKKNDALAKGYIQKIIESERFEQDQILLILLVHSNTYFSPSFWQRLSSKLRKRVVYEVKKTGGLIEKDKGRKKKMNQIPIDFFKYGTYAIV